MFTRVPLAIKWRRVAARGHLSARPIGPAELGHWSTSAAKWVQDAEAFDVWVGADSLATLHADLAVIG
jgi:hypothetical protein